MDEVEVEFPNFANAAELREIVTVIEALEALDANFGSISLDNIQIYDVNGEIIGLLILKNNQFAFVSAVAENDGD